MIIFVKAKKVVVVALIHYEVEEMIVVVVAYVLQVLAVVALY